ncbi:F-box/LRR-repeat protein 15 [Helianthus annuus]|uniref:Putative F-box family protein n=1 Tax=Helianthus annuus TaxID=4232 RepID=A0A251V4K6_HELAN|nr:F-box/LRR-repeat protein 15 [Helianthus annuus]XP_022027624.1 F-box/LRR-repeat protein 15 [Helianthus annuus]
MKIWCWLCFGEEEEHNNNNYKREVVMEKEGTLVINDVDEGKHEELGFCNFGGDDGENVQMQLGSLEEGSSNLDVGLNLGSSSLAAGSEMEGLDRGGHCKRPKVNSLAMEGDTPFVRVPAQESNPFGLSEEEYERMAAQYLQPVSDGEETDHLVDSTSCEVNEDDQVSAEINDCDNRMDLTDDLLHMVFSFLDHINLCKAAKVCKQWHTASAHEDFWWFLNFENRNISPQQFESMCSRYPNATRVNIKGAPAIHTLAMQSLSSLRNLAMLTLGKGQLGEPFFQALTDCTMLNSLTVIDAVLGNGHQEIPIYHDRLRHLQIVKCRMVRISVRCPELETLSLKRSSMAHAVLNCPLLRDLDIASCHKLLDAAVRSAATSCPLLESLDMSNCSCVSDETLREISLICENLHILNASYCPNISLESVRLPMLTVLKLHSCEGITSASIAAISYSYVLEVLELDNCSLLTSVFLDLSHLRNIRLVHCRKLVDVSLRSMVLSSIRISNCPLLQRINITSSSLQQLILQKQESLTTLELHCECLQEVDLTDCESLTNSIFEVFSDRSGCGCPLLKSLILDNCERLTTVVFSSGSVRSLSFAGCRAITSLELTCPNLEQVTLDGCDHLENATFCPVGLSSLNLGICPKLNVLNIDAPSMVQLELKGCGVLSQSLINCPLLKSLDASFCSQLKDDFLSTTTASCPLIESLILMSCPSIGSDGLMSLRYLPNLTLLDLSYTFLLDLQPVFDSCLKLKVLKLQACKYLTDSSLEPLYKDDALPALLELDLSYGTLCHSAIQELIACCTHLTHLNLNGCVNMNDMNWNLTNDHDFNLDVDIDSQPHLLLQNLNCVGCPNTKKVIIPRLARFSHLSSLNLSLSANLKDVDLACSNLCFLNLSNCCSLESLKLECPRLTTLFLQSCNIGEEVVESAISHCNMLETLDVRFCPKISPLSMGRLRTACPSLKRIFNSLVPV